MKMALFTRFRKDEDGGILAFTLIMFLMLVVGGGMAVDFIHHEYQREKTQDVLDRAVLAAAAIGKADKAITPAQIAAAETESINVARSYLSTSGLDPDAPGVNIQAEFTMNSQMVSATSDFSVRTSFLKLAGIDTLNGAAGAAAFVSQSDIEIALVLDVSGSMGGSKIRNLRTEGSRFVGNMLDGDRKDYTYLSVIPFNHSVNIGVDTLNRFSNQVWHNYSACGTFTSSAYNSAAINPNSGFIQTGHIHKNGGNLLCNAGQAIVYSNNATELQNMIGGLRAGGATAGYIGMKWATGLLDPAAQPIVQSLIDEGRLSDNFTGRPAAYDDDNTLKFIIFMSDGQMNTSYRFKPWQYQKVRNNNGQLLPAHSVENADWWDTTGRGSRPYYQRFGPGWSSTLAKACNTAKAQGIIVFTIAYGLTPGSSADQALSNCATTTGHYFNVATDDLDQAFASIESTIQRLKLIN